MQSNGDNNFIFSPNFNFGNDSLLTINNSDHINTFPPVAGDMTYCDNNIMLYLFETPMLYL